ncbi:MAG: flagellar filament capping protein FliD [Thermodesulfobacteriota bacterium]
MTIGVGGLVSGLDTESIITQVMDLERRPVLLLQAREADFQSKISALGSMKGGLSALQSAAQSLQDADSFTAYKTTNGNHTALSASASQDASPGTYLIDLTSLATSQQVRSEVFTASDEIVGTGTLTIQVGANDAIDVVIDSDHQTLAGIATAINEAATDVTASVIDDGNGNFYLTLASSETGAANTISMTMVDDDGTNNDAAGLSNLYTNPVAQTLTETQAAGDAQLTVNGITVERTSNSITDLIGGVTLTLKEADPGNPFEVTVAKDLNSVKSKIQAFVSEYNNMIDIFGGLQSYDAETEEAGPLIGDSTTRQLRSRLGAMLYDQVDGVASEVNGLSRLGVEVGRDGKLTLDDAKLTTALENYPDEVTSFFTNTEVGNEGIALRFDNLLESYLSTTNGLLAAKEDGLQDSIDDMGEQVDRINYRLLKKEETLRNQFLALEMILGELQATSGALDQQLESLSNLNASIYKK